MKEVSDKLTIRILIGRQEHEINIRRQDEEVFRKAAKIITEQLGRYEQKFRGQSYETYLSITLLDFVVHSIRHQKDMDFVLDSIKDISKEIDEELDSIKEKEHL